MKKYFISLAVSGIDKKMPKEELEELKNQLADKADSVELRIMHDAFMREKIGKIEYFARSVRDILLICFIIAIVAGIISVLVQ